MATCLRKIERKREWEDPRNEEPWLKMDDLRADALRDLETDSNSLSVYEISDEVPVQRIIAALAATRDRLVKVDFILFDSTILNDLNIAHEKVPGNTPDAAVNSCHVDLVQLTAHKLSEFGARIRAGGGATRRLPKEVGRLLKESIDQGFIDRISLKPGVADHLRP